MPNPHPVARPHCYRCDKPQSLCICALLTPLDNRIGVHVLQHPRERRHPVGTVRLLRLGLSSLRVHVLALRGRSAACDPVELPPGAGLLYPAADARDLTTLAPADRPTHIVVIDGTWTHAHRIYRDNHWIQAMPKFRIAPEQGSRYRIRAEPRHECLSTVESVVEALRWAEPDLKGTETLDAAFDAMIDAQIAAAEGGSSHVRAGRRRRKIRQPVPEILREAAAVVVVHAEIDPHGRDETGARSPLRLSAVSLDGERRFDRWVSVPTPPDPHVCESMELDPAQLVGAATLSEVLEAFTAFCACEATPVVLAPWGAWTQRWLAGRFEAWPCVLLKGVWANVHQGRVPALNEVVDSLGLAVADLGIPGRGGRRLSEARAVAAYMLSDPSG